MDASRRHVFVFAAGWRTGSTLLQRVVSSSNEVFVWGEQFEMGTRLLDTYELFEHSLLELYEEESFRAVLDQDVVDVWQPGLNPPPDDLADAFRELLDTLYFGPLSETPYRGWGWKTVRYGRDFYEWLARIFPEAKFVFLTRNPYHALESLKGRAYFGRNRFEAIDRYVRLFEEFASLKKEDAGFFVTYEDFTTSREARDELFDYLELPSVDLDAFARSGRSNHIDLSWREVDYLERHGDVIEEFGYAHDYDRASNPVDWTRREVRAEARYRYQQLKWNVAQHLDE